MAPAAIIAAGVLFSAQLAQAAPASGIDTGGRVADYLGATSIDDKGSFASANRLDRSQPSFITEMLEGIAFDTPRATRRGYAGEVFVGGASTYNPCNPDDRDSGGARTTSGEIYDADGWTAAIRTDLRWYFGGVRYGQNYQPVRALVEGAGKRVIVRINDVGPLKPGRIIDLNEQAMHYLDPTMTIGVIDGVTVTPLFGEGIAVGPVEAPPTTMAGDFELYASAPHVLGNLDNRPQFGPLLFLG